MNILPAIIRADEFDSVKLDPKKLQPTCKGPIGEGKKPESQVWALMADKFCRGYDFTTKNDKNGDRKQNFKFDDLGSESLKGYNITWNANPSNGVEECHTDCRKSIIYFLNENNGCKFRNCAVLADKGSTGPDLETSYSGLG
jgi:hypothetical protein